MSTRSTIAMLSGNDSVRAVYCHSDGYPAYVGAMLRQYYDTPEKVEQLLGMGFISMLEPAIGEKHPFDVRGYGQSTFYKRDRGDEESDAVTIPVAELGQFADMECDAEWVYLFKEGEWYTSPVGKNLKFEPVWRVLRLGHSLRRGR